MKTIIAISAAAVLLIGGSLWSRSIQAGDTDTISTNGIHWHAKLSILSGDTPVTIPGNIGIGAVHQPIHTHDDDPENGTLHLEFGGVVHKSDLQLGNFFHTWDKDIQTAYGTLKSMTVNGATSTAYDLYEVHDDDDIVLRYE